MQPLTTNAKTILHGAAQYCLQDKNGQIADTHSIMGHNPGVSPLHNA